MKERYYAELDTISNNYNRLIKIEEADNLDKTTYIYESNLSNWIQNKYFLELQFDRKIYDEVSKDIAYTLISRWEKDSFFSNA